MMQAQLGLIPNWVYSVDPGVNIKLDPHVSFPDGWSQRTIQPVGSYYGVAKIARPDLGRPMSIKSRFQRLFSPACCENCVCGESCPGCPSYSGYRAQSMRGLGGFAQEHPLLLVLGGLGLVAAAGYGVLHSKRGRKKRR